MGGAGDALGCKPQGWAPQHRMVGGIWEGPTGSPICSPTPLPPPEAQAGVRVWPVLSSLQNVCHTLWCSVGTTCHSKLDSAVDGTRCGENKVGVLQPPPSWWVRGERPGSRQGLHPVLLPGRAWVLGDWEGAPDSSIPPGRG